MQEKQSTLNNRAKKAERREAKALRKEKNKVEDKKSRPNNFIIFLIICLILGGIFGGVMLYNYMQKSPSIEKYIEENKEMYGEQEIYEGATMKYEAKGNSLTITNTIKTEDADSFKEYYSSDEGKESIRQMAASQLETIKPNVRGMSADATMKVVVNGKEIVKEKVTHKEAKKILEKASEQK